MDARTDLHRRILELERAWEQFMAGQGLTGHVRPMITRSWERCRQSGVEPLKTVAPTVLEGARLTEYWRQHPIYADVEPLLADLSAIVPDSGHLVVVSDETGKLMRVEGDSATRRRAEAMNFLPGAQWSELAAGTNAIGTALAAVTPIQVLAAEHLCQIVHPWTCSAAPIRDPATGQVLGVIDVTGLRRSVHPHSLAVVMAVARAVEEQMQKRRQALDLLLRAEYLRESGHVGSDWLAALGPGGQAVAFSPQLAERELLNAKGRMAALAPEVLRQAVGGELEREAESPRGERLILRVRAVQSGGKLAGYLVRVSQLGRGERRSVQRLRYSFSTVLGESPAIQEAIRRARMVADQALHVLLLGESGTGKEVLAQAIHAASPRRNGPFIALNCAAIPAELLASELFGYEPGAFTGARRDGHAGKFEQAARGTLFLDEIGDMPLESQAHLLRVLEEHEVVRLGGARPIRVDIRLVAATNVDLDKRVAEGRFRADLYYRLSVWQVHLPPLRERCGDVAVLLSAFLARSRAELGRPPVDVSPAALALLEGYAWPGNVRELRNVITQLALESVGDAILPEHLPPRIRGGGTTSAAQPANNARPTAVRPARRLRDQDRDLVVQTLAACGGNVTEAARCLGVHRSTVYRILERRRE